METIMTRLRLIDLYKLKSFNMVDEEINRRQILAIKRAKDFMNNSNQEEYLKAYEKFNSSDYLIWYK